MKDIMDLWKRKRSEIPLPLFFRHDEKTKKFQNHPSHPSRLHTNSDNFVSVPQSGMHFLNPDGLKENTELAIVATLQEVGMGGTKFLHDFNQGQGFKGLSG